MCIRDRYITVDGIRYMLPYRRFNNVDLDMYNKLFQFDGKMLWRQYTEISDFQQCIKFLLHVYQHVTDNDEMCIRDRLYWYVMTMEKL